MTERLAFACDNKLVKATSLKTAVRSVGRVLRVATATAEQKRRLLSGRG